MKSTNSGKLSELWGAANTVINEVEKWLHSRDKRQLRLNFRPLDQARLLKLRLWQERYYVEIPEILDLIMPILRAQVRQKRRSGGLGISIAAMTGTGAEKILMQELKKKYPDGENKSVYREQERERQLQAERDSEFDGMQTRDRRVRFALDEVAIGDFVKAYQNKIISHRVAVQAELANPVRKRKPYRGNCWR